MLVFRGAPAISEFRLRKLADRLREHTGTPIQPYAEYVHFAQLAGDLNVEERAVLERLLRDGPSLPGHAPEGALVLVVPRPGTISPWSSKATDIARNCGLTAVKRLERGIAYSLAGGISDQTRRAASTLLHDRMTELALFDLE